VRGVSVGVGVVACSGGNNIDNIYRRKKRRTRAKCQQRLKPKEG